MIIDYFFIRRQELAVQDLYQPKGVYTYRRGVNPMAIVALLAGILPNVPGFLTTIGAMDKNSFWPWVPELYHYACFCRIKSMTMVVPPNKAARVPVS